jgi:hypothetical protein
LSHLGIPPCEIVREEYTLKPSAKKDNRAIGDSGFLGNYPSGSGSLKLILQYPFAAAGSKKQMEPADFYQLNYKHFQKARFIAFSRGR